MTGRRVITREAHAKVNLALAVGPRNAEPPAGDGLHPIASWMAPIDLRDHLTVTRLEPNRDSRYAIVWDEQAPRQSPIDWSITKDLAVRAHMSLEREVGGRLPVQLKLIKRIPIGAGLAGGSSDAAATLLAVRDAFELDVSNDRLRELALTVGSDAGFFVPIEGSAPGPALVRGTGDLVEPTPAARQSGAEAALVLILPEFDCSTPAVYRAFDEDQPERFREDEAGDLARRGELDPAGLFNDLAEPAQRVEPRLGEVVRAAQRAAEAPVHVTGSGAGCFVVCESDEAERTAERLRESLPACAVVVSRMIRGAEQA